MILFFFMAFLISQSSTFPSIGLTFFLDWGEPLRLKLNKNNQQVQGGTGHPKLQPNCGKHEGNVQAMHSCLIRTQRSQMIWFTTPACKRKSFPIFLGKELTTEEDEEALQVSSTLVSNPHLQAKPFFMIFRQLSERSVEQTQLVLEYFKQNAGKKY